MADPVLYDAVTLRHFSSISRLDLLELCHGYRSEPRWVAAVRNEISVADRSGFRECRSILDTTWLGEPLDPEEDDLGQIARLQIALGNAGFEEEDAAEKLKHRGEAESIQQALKYGYFFVTDDNDAHSVASFRLGGSRVLDTVDLLRLAVANSDLTPPEAVETAHRIQGLGRSLRRQYERLLTVRDF